MFTAPENTIFQICANCQSACGPYQLYCKDCGWILPQALADDPNAHAYATQNVDGSPRLEVDLQWGATFFHQDAQLYLRVMDMETLISVPIRATPIVIGRRGGSAIPHVDLMPYGAFDLGVSRYHARIDRANNMLQVTDLESNNGTVLNNQRLAPKIPYVLPNLSILQIGQMTLRVIFA
jgi:hypothetical protein